MNPDLHKNIEATRRGKLILDLATIDRGLAEWAANELERGDTLEGVKKRIAQALETVQNA